MKQLNKISKTFFCSNLVYIKSHSPAPESGFSTFGAASDSEPAFGLREISFSNISLQTDMNFELTCIATHWERCRNSLPETHEMFKRTLDLGLTSKEKRKWPCIQFYNRRCTNCDYPEGGKLSHCMKKTKIYFIIIDLWSSAKYSVSFQWILLFDLRTISTFISMMSPTVHFLPFEFGDTIWIFPGAVPVALISKSNKTRGKLCRSL